MRRTRILSDLHLGHPSSLVTDIDQIAPLFEGIDHLVLAGDSWQERFKGPKKSPALALRQDLENRCAQKKIELTFLRGNHDPDTGAGHLFLHENRILVTHGDSVYRRATPWSREMSTFRQQIDEIVREFEPHRHDIAACTERARRIALAIKSRPLTKLPPPFNFFATALWPPSRPFEMLRIWKNLGQDLLAFLDESGGGADILVCGHFHRPGIWQRCQKGKVAINLGAFMPGTHPLAVDLNATDLTVTKVIRKNQTFHPGPRQALFDLPTAANRSRGVPPRQNTARRRP